jgi:hypothetical protein
VADVVYVSESVVTRERGPLRSATVPGRDEPVTFGVHGAIAQHYGVDPDDVPHDTTTIDYVVAAAGG